MRRGHRLLVIVTALLVILLPAILQAGSTQMQVALLRFPGLNG